MECYQVPSAQKYLVSGTIYALDSNGDETAGVAVSNIVLFEDGDGELQTNKVGVMYDCQIAVSIVASRPTFGTRIVLGGIAYKVLTVTRNESLLISPFWLCKLKTIN